MSIQVTDSDIVLLGHGTYKGGAQNFKLPDGVELYIVQPVGYTLMTTVAEALIGQQAIAAIKLHHKDSTPPDAWLPEPLAGGAMAPDLILHDLDTLAKWGQKTIGARRNVVTVDHDTRLSELLSGNAAIKAAIKAQTDKGKKLRVFWSACAAQIDGPWADMQ
jgi:hypothetical protein